MGSDAGVLLLRRAEEHMGLMRVQRLYALCCGWEDVSVHNTLRHDLALQTAFGARQP